MTMSQPSAARYVFDSGPLFQLFMHYDSEVFPHLWEDFRRMMLDGRIMSVREVRQEIVGPGNLLQWAEENKVLFLAPDAAQTEFVRDMLADRHNQGLIDRKKIMGGGFVADPFVIALALAKGGCVVTAEKYKPNAPKIPTLCKKYGIPCVDLSGFMKQEGWKYVREK